MKAFLLPIVCVSIASVGLAQTKTPQTFNYQGVVRTSTGIPMGGKTISLRLSVMNAGNTEYYEVRKITTNSLGMYNIQVGAAGAVSTGTGKFSDIKWAEGSKSLKVDIDLNGGTSWSVGGESPINAIPYALYAEKGGTSGYNTWAAKAENAGKNQEAYLSQMQDDAITQLKKKASDLTPDSEIDGLLTINNGTGAVLQAASIKIHKTVFDAASQSAVKEGLLNADGSAGSNTALQDAVKSIAGKATSGAGGFTSNDKSTTGTQIIEVQNGTQSSFKDVVLSVNKTNLQNAVAEGFNDPVNENLKEALINNFDASTLKNKKDITSTDFEVSNGTGAVTSDANVVLNLKPNAVSLDKINPGEANQVMITNKDGGVEWKNAKDVSGIFVDGKTINGDGLATDPIKVADAGITDVQLADKAITTAKILDANITTAKIAAGTANQVMVTNAAGAVAWMDKSALAAALADGATIDGDGTAANPFKIMDLGVTTAKIADANITTAKILDQNITTEKVADKAVTTAKILDANVTTAKIAAGTANQVMVTNAAGAVAWMDKSALAAALADGATIDGDGTAANPFKIMDLGVTTAKIADANITTAKILDQNITTEKVADKAVTTAKILDANVTTAKIAAGTANQVMVTNAVGTVAWMDKSALAAALADGATIDGDGTAANPFKIMDLGVTTAKIADANITTAKILDANVTTAKIAAGTANQVMVTNAVGTVAWLDKSALAAALADGATIDGDGTAANPFKIMDLGVTTAKIADANITTAKILDQNITTTKIADKAVTTAKILDANVTTAKIAAGTANQVMVTNAVGAVTWMDKSALAAALADGATIDGDGTAANPFKIMDLGVTTAKIADANITTEKILDHNITTEKVADNAVTTAKILDANVTTAKIAAGTANQVMVTDAAGAVTWMDKSALAAALADGATIDGDGTAANPFKIMDLGVTTAKIADANITTAKILDQNITTEKIADKAVTTAKILDANVTTAKIAAGIANQVMVTNGAGAVAWLDKSALAAALADGATIDGDGTAANPFKIMDLGVTTAKIADANITTAKILDQNITTEKIADKAVTSAKILDANITTAKIAAGTANQVMVTNAVGTVAWLDKSALAAALADGATIDGDGTAANPFKIMDLGVTTAKIADANITTAKILDQNITTEKVADKAVTTAKILDANVTTAKIAAGTANQVMVTNAVGTVAWVDKSALAAALADGATIDGDGTAANPFKIMDLGVTTAKIADANITTAKILDQNITSTKIADKAVTTAKIAIGTANQVLLTNAAGTATEWADLAARTNLTGDVTGTAAANKVEKIQNVAVSPTAPTASQVLQYDGVAKLWTPSTAVKSPFIAGTTNITYSNTSVDSLKRNLLIATVSPNGAGTKMMFLPNKAALRAGIVNGTQWDDANVGSASFAGNNNTTAPSFAETTIGTNNTTYVPASSTAWNATDRLFTVGNGKDAASPSNALTILKDGKMGINDSNPGVALTLVNDVKGELMDDFVMTTYGNTTPGIIINKAMGTKAAPANMLNGDAMGSLSFGAMINGGFNSFLSGMFSFYKGNGITPLTDMTFRTSGLNRMTIDPNGYVGIATTTPYSILHIENDNTGNDSNDDIRITSYGNSTPGMILFRSRGSKAAPINLQNGDNMSNILMGGRINGNDNDGFQMSSIHTIYRGNGGNASNEMNFVTSGRLNMKLNELGNLVLQNGGGTSLNGWSSLSDRRLKTNIFSIQDGLDKIMQLNPVVYDKKASLESNDYYVHEMGFIAQEIQKVLPEIVQEDQSKDKILSVNYEGVIPVLTKAVQEQQAQIKAQQDKINQQEKDLQALKAMVLEMQQAQKN